MRRGRGERRHRHVGELRHEPVQAEVVLAEIVPPLADAMGLVDGDHRQAGGLEDRHEVLHHQPLGRQVQQVQFPGRKAPRDAGAVRAVEGTVEQLRPQPVGDRGVDLVLHQRDQRADDQARALHHVGGQLVAQALAPAGGHDGEHIPPGQHG